MGWHPRVAGCRPAPRQRPPNPNEDTETRTRLFLTYWKLNEDMPVGERQAVAQRLTASGLFPPDDVEIVRWDGTPDGWGILVAEADSAEAIGQALNMWRVAGDGFFEETVTAPAQPVQEAIAGTQELLEAVPSAD